MSRITSLESTTRAILVPVDFEPAARAALIFAARLARGTGGPLRILHVVHEPADRPNYYRRRGESEASLPIELLAERRLDEFLADVRRLNPGLSALDEPGVLLVKGVPATRIAEVANKLGASQIVMGHARPSGFFSNLLASLSDRVADQSDIPVTVIHPDGKSEVVAMPPQKRLGGNMALDA